MYLAILKTHQMSFWQNFSIEEMVENEDLVVFALMIWCQSYLNIRGVSGKI